MTVTVNGEARTVAGGTLTDLLQAEGVDPATRFLAVAVNGAVVPRGRWAETPVTDGDRVEIVKPVSGG